MIWFQNNGDGTTTIKCYWFKHLWEKGFSIGRLEFYFRLRRQCGELPPGY